jgi:hypothetical protein
MIVVDLYLLAKTGFLVIASDYRFHGPTAKRDAWGRSRRAVKRGAPVRELLSLQNRLI